MNNDLLKKLIKSTLSEFVSLMIGWIAVALFFNYFFFGYALTSLTMNYWYMLAGSISVNLFIVFIKIIYQYRNIMHQKN